MTIYQITVISGRRWVYRFRAYCPGDAMRHVMRINRSANWLNTFCQAV